MACASFACLAQASFASQQYAQDSAPYLWMILCALVASSSGLILLSRNSHPQAVFWTACLLVVVLPFDSLLRLIGDVRAASMRIDTWIDIQQLGQLDDSISMIAYRVVQEGLTMKRFVKCFFELLTQIIVKVQSAKGLRFALSACGFGWLLLLDEVVPLNRPRALRLKPRSCCAWRSAPFSRIFRLRLKICHARLPGYSAHASRARSARRSLLRRGSR